MQAVTTVSNNQSFFTFQKLNDLKQQIVHITRAAFNFIINVIRGIFDWIFNKNRVVEKEPPKLPVSTPKQPPVTYDFEKLPPKVLDMIFSNLSFKDQARLSQVSHAINAIADEKWNKLAKQLSLPIVPGQSTVEKIAQLLSYFDIDPKTNKATILKRNVKIKEALSIYPIPAWLLVPIKGSEKFDFYLHKGSGVVEASHFDPRDIGVSPSDTEIGKIMMENSIDQLQIL